MSNEERRRVLQMIAEGKVSPAEADEVLDALEPEPAAMPFTAPLAPGVKSLTAVAAPVPPSRYDPWTLEIKISEDEKEICVTVPPGLEPEQQQLLVQPATEYLERYNIHLAELLRLAPRFPRETTLVKLSDGELSIEVRLE